MCPVYQRVRVFASFIRYPEHVLYIEYGCIFGAHMVRLVQKRLSERHVRNEGVLFYRVEYLRS